MLGTVILGLAITIGNIAVPLIIRRDLSHPQGAAWASTPRTEHRLVPDLWSRAAGRPAGWRHRACGQCRIRGDGCRLLGARGGAAVPLFPAAMPVAGPGRPAASLTMDHGGPDLGVRRQAFSYYGVTAWLPSLLADELGWRPAAAGAGSSLFQILAIAGGWASRWRPACQYDGGGGSPWVHVADGPAGPAAGAGAVVAVVFLRRQAQGGGITLIFIAIIQAGPRPGLGGADVGYRPRRRVLHRGRGADPPGLRPRVSGSWTGPLL